jgi:hypothetical protein
MDFSLTINGYLFKHLCAVIFDGLLGVVCPFALFLLTIMFSVLLRFTDYDYPVGIYKLFSINRE